MKGTTVQLAVDTVTGYDPFGNPITEEEFVDVPDVLVGQPTSDDIVTTTQLYGKRIEYMLGIPKGDTHDWTDKDVEWVDAYGRTIKCRTFGIPVTGVEANVPGPWHMIVKCEAYG